MAENDSTTKVEEQKKPADGADASAEQDAESSEGLLDLDSLDEVLRKEDPEFAKSLESIGPDSGIEIYNEALEVDYKPEDEEKKWESGSAFQRKLATALPFLPKLSYKIKMLRVGIRLKLSKWKDEAIKAIWNAGPALLKWLKGLLASFKTGLSNGLEAFKYFSLVKKLAFVGLVVATGVAGVIVSKALSHKLIPPEQELFISSLEEWATKAYQYNPEETRESFFDSTRTSQNMIELRKMMANIKPSASSGPNPMAMMEFVAEGTDADVVVEIKDREPEMTDLFLRTIEEMTFDQISTGEGKQLLCDRLRKELNKVLTKGKVRRIFIKTSIIKP